jgi:chromosomal replication initiation ATPase DnaA
MELNNVLEAVCFVMGQDVERVKSKQRYRHLVICRHLFYYLSKYYYGAKLKEIGSVTGNSDHTSVIHGIQVINDMISIKDEQIVKAVAEIQEYISKRYKADKKISVFVPYNVNLTELAQLLQNNYGCRVIL